MTSQISERDAWRNWAIKELNKYRIAEAATATDDRLRDLLTFLIDGLGAYRDHYLSTEGAREKLAAWLEAHPPEQEPKP